MPLPNSLRAYLRAAPYHPQKGTQLGNVLSAAIVTDLLATCQPLAAKAAAGEVVWDTNFNLIYGTTKWNADLVIGQPPPGTAPPLGEPIRKAAPSSVHIAVEIKTVMTEHKKAVKNRKRELEAHHTHVHDYSARAIAGGVLIVNIAGRFKSPLREPHDITTHKDPKRLVKHCMNEARAISERGGPIGSGLDAKAVLVVDDDNINWAAAEFYERPPAPQVGDPMHYDAFIQRLCAEWRSRFAS
jgi:hypothetical protein